MATIHPTAIVNPEAKLAKSVKIGPYVIIESDVSIDSDTEVAAYTYIGKHTTVGGNCRIHMGAVVGHEPQMLKKSAAQGNLIIGNSNIIREYCTIHRATQAGHSTVIGNDNFLMAFSHVAHDCQLSNHIVLCNGALLAGYTEVDDYAFISGNVTVHQFVRIGKYVMVGGLARVNKDIPPYMLVKGDSEIWALNSVGLKRANFSATQRAAIKEAFKIIFKSNLNLKQAINALQKKTELPEVKELIQFIIHAQRGICAYRRSRFHISIPFFKKHALGYRFFSRKLLKKDEQ